jgi:hypothetical protein
VAVAVAVAVTGRGWSGCLQMMDCVTITYDSSLAALHLEWVASPEADLWADAVVSVALQASSAPQAIRCALRLQQADVGLGRGGLWGWTQR